MTDSSFVYGVDFGMTTSSLAIMTGTGGLELVRDPAMGPNEPPAIPTAVCAAEPGAKDLIVGQAAVNARVGRPRAYRDNFKRDVARGRQIYFNDQLFEVADVVAAVLRFLYDQAQAIAPGPPAATVLTVPADWAEGRQDVMRSAALAAGYPPDSLFFADEPTASIEYARSLGFMTGRPVTLVYDLGGSTLDCAAVRPSGPDSPDARATTGCEIGGSDFDADILAEVQRRFPAQYTELDGELGKAEPWRADRLRRACEAVKCRLSAQGWTHEFLYDLPGSPRFELSRDEFETLIAASVDRTIDTAESALAKLGLKWPDVDAVLPIGGSARIPLVQRRLSAKAPGKLLLIPDGDFAPALGAAVIARREADRGAAARAPASADLVAASPWSPRALAKPCIAEAAKEPEIFSRAYLVAIWMTLAAVIASGGLIAWRLWNPAGWVGAGLSAIALVSLAAAFTWKPERNSAAASWLCGLSVIATVVFLTLTAVYGFNREASSALGSGGTSVLLITCAAVCGMASARALRARTSGQAFARDRSVTQQVRMQRWFGDSTHEEPSFLNPLFRIPALRGFRLRTGAAEDERYVLAAGSRVLLIAMLNSPDQRPVLEQWEGSLDYDLSRGSVRTILVAPGPVPPSVPANEAFDSAAIITTRGGLPDIVGRWLEQDNRLVIPLLSALLRSTDMSLAQWSTSGVGSVSPHHTAP